MRFMYTNSKSKIKLLNKLSEKIDVICGTEQGHPMSPEHFKCVLHHLSEDLNSMENVEVPLLKSTRVTHLLWADNLNLLALDQDSRESSKNVRSFTHLLSIRVGVIG